MSRRPAQPKKRQKFTREYKLEAVRLSLQGTKSELFKRVGTGGFVAAV
jgi:transposase-like protein